MLKGTLEGIVLALLAGRSGVRLRDHGVAARAGLLRHRRGHRLRPADQDRAARPRRRGEGPVREGAAAQGVLAQRTGRGTARRLLEDLELPRRNASNSSAKERTDMVAKWIETLTGSLEQKKQYKQDKARIEALPEPYGSTRQGVRALLHVLRRRHRRRHARHDARRLRRPVGARRARRDTGARDRRRRPGRVRRDLRPGLRRQPVDRQGARPPDQGDRGRGAEEEQK